MPNEMTFDNSQPTAVVEAEAAEQQNSLEVGEALEQEQQQLLAGKYRDAQELEKAYLELQGKLGEPQQQQEEQVVPTEDSTDESEPDDENDLSTEELNNIYQAAGGQENYNALMRWALDNFSANEVQAYDAIVESGDANAIAFALQAVMTKYSDAMGTEGSMLTGKSAPNVKASYRSQAELIADMNDPRYEVDPAYRNDVMNKLANSPDLQF